MSKISRRGLRITAAAAGAGVIAAAAWATAAQAGPVHAAAAPMKSNPVSTRVQLAPMPQGTVTFDRDNHGYVDVTISALGLTPGSSHTVVLTNGRITFATFSPLTADSTGQARDETLHSGYRDALRSLWAAVLNGDGVSSVTLLTIARTTDVDGRQRTYQLIPAETDQDGGDWGTPQGSAVVAYDRDAQTISVTVNASGFTPGAHAAHIHLGSCAAQGPVQYMLTDFTANADGKILDQTRVVTHATTPPPAHGWYFNLHQGSGRDIVANGRPTINFRPLLCGDILCGDGASWQRW
jgi:Cu/Zn superoxide dismutase